MTATIIVPARSEPEADRLAAVHRIPDGCWTWCDPAYAYAYADTCAARGVPTFVLTARSVARTVAVRTQHEWSAA
ncbi:hypothetical protein [Nocardioides sp.]|uniref:hypothetical protein n=1 Tax=Nocardioides sp. TaxID=35761 RepID=UPI002BE31A2D|nr:hypothetical protein [Nocardioides sp.]HXH79547.1 hypothetical protein [Nocardioides sp.]